MTKHAAGAMVALDADVKDVTDELGKKRVTFEGVGELVGSKCEGHSVVR